jgi:MFS family permease
VTRAARGDAAIATGSSASRPSHRDPRRWYALALLCLAPFIDTLGFTSVFPAGPTMERALGLSQAGLQWTFTAATLPGIALLLAGGRLCDILGRRRMFMAGVALLALASLACGLRRLPRGPRSAGPAPPPASCWAG